MTPKIVVLYIAKILSTKLNVGTKIYVLLYVLEFLVSKAERKKWMVQFALRSKELWISKCDHNTVLWYNGVPYRLVNTVTPYLQCGCNFSCIFSFFILFI